MIRLVVTDNIDKDIFKTRLVNSPFLNKQLIFILLNLKENLRYFDFSVFNNEIQIAINSVDQLYLLTPSSHFFYKGNNIIYTFLVLSSIIQCFFLFLNNIRIINL